MASRPIWRGYLRLALVSCPLGRWAARDQLGQKDKRRCSRFGLRPVLFCPSMAYPHIEGD
jgi:hypothetical protein